MAAVARVRHANMFDTSTSDFSATDSDSLGSGGDFMDNYIKQTGAKPMQIDDGKPKLQKEEASIPDMASLFSDETKAQSQLKPQEPSWSASTDMANFFATSFDSPPGGIGSFNMDAPAKVAGNANIGSHTNEMTSLFRDRNGDSAASVGAASARDSTFGWAWDAPKMKKEDENHSDRDLWSSHSDRETSIGSSGYDTANMFSADTGSSGSSHSMFSGWSSNDFGGNAGVSQPAHAPPQQDDTSMKSVDSPIQGPTQRESSISGVSATNQVIDVRLSSELQQSFLQANSAAAVH